jgi:urease alpha subunit
MTYANTGQGNGSTVYVQPQALRRMYGSLGDAPHRLGRIFVSAAGLANRALADGPYASRLLGVRGTRGIGRRDMVRNDAVPEVRVDRESFRVYVDGVEAVVPPATNLPLSRRYFL